MFNDVFQQEVSTIPTQEIEEHISPLDTSNMPEELSNDETMVTQNNFFCEKGPKS